MKLNLIVLVLTFSAFAGAEEIQAVSLTQKAHHLAHELASKSATRSLPMFNYVYYADGFCRDQVCTDEKIKTETEAAKTAMGADFDQLNQNRKAYRRLISRLQRTYAPSDLASLGSLRSGEVIVKNGIFITANDMSKAIIYLAQRLGESTKNLRYMMMMVKEGYLKMCPARDGRAPILPRPVTYAVVAFKNAGRWFAVNPENPTFEIRDLGGVLPARLSVEITYQIPAPMNGKVLVNAGAYRASTIEGFTPNELIGMTASGQLEDDLASLQCL